MSGDAVEPAVTRDEVEPAGGSAAGAGAGAGEPVGSETHEGEERVSRIGRRAGVVLGIGAVAGLAVLAGFGFTPALYLLVLAVAGTFMVILGARLH